MTKAINHSMPLVPDDVSGHRLSPYTAHSPNWQNYSHYCFWFQFPWNMWINTTVRKWTPFVSNSVALHNFLMPSILFWNVIRCHLYQNQINMAFPISYTPLIHVLLINKLIQLNHFFSFCSTEYASIPNVLVFYSANATILLTELIAQLSWISIFGSNILSIV